LRNIPREPSGFNYKGDLIEKESRGKLSDTMPTRESVPNVPEMMHDVVTVIVDPVKYDTCTRGVPEEIHQEQVPAPIEDSLPESLSRHGRLVGGKRESRGPAPEFTSIRLPT
jgi:hypothetical protein